MKKVMIVDDNYLSTEGIVKNINWKRLEEEVTHVENNGESAIEAIKIEHAFAAIDREHRNMELLKQSRPVLTEKFFLDLLHYSGNDARTHLGRYAEYLNLKLDYNSFSVIKLEIENSASIETELGITQYQMELMNVVDLLQETFSVFDTVYFVKEFSLLSFSDSREEELIQLICQKNTQAIDQWLHNFFQDLSQKCYTKNILFIRIYSLLGRILKFLYELNIDTSDLENKIISVYNQFDQFSTYEQFYQWMNDLCILVCQKLDTSLNSYHTQLCELVQSYIIENFEDNTLCLNDIAKHANVSPAYLSALYKKNCGQSISDTISSCRIEKACQYLTKSTLSLKEISTRCGYTNQYYFSNSFKKKLGVSPSVYREQNTQLSPS